MAHPKSRISKSKKNKRRTHHGVVIPQIATCKVTGEAHMMHRAYWHEGSMFYKGKVVIQAPEEDIIVE